MLEAGPLIVARLEERLAAITPRPRVLTAADLSGVVESKQPSPAVHVVFGGHKVDAVHGTGRITEMTLTWLTVVAIRNARPRSDEMHVDAGVLMDAVYEALAGWRIGDNLGHLVAVTPPKAGHSAGFGYYPLAWTHQRIARA